MAIRWTASQVDCYVVTGEVSGDDRAAEVVSYLQDHNPLMTFAGVAGPKLRALGISGTHTMEDLLVMGFIDVIKALPRVFKVFSAVKKEILNLNPQMVLLVDYPGFNLRLAKALRKAGYTGKIVQYVCPTVWAWGKRRIPVMEQTLDKLFTLFPFEPKHFNQAKLDAKYIGHPLTHPQEVRERWESSFDQAFLAIFPGSRKKEIEMNLPIQLQAAEKRGIPFVVSCAHEKLLPSIERIVGQRAEIVPPKFAASLIDQCSFAIATSGTITLQLALADIPTVCTYGIKPLDVFIAQKIFRINLPFYCIVNILGDREVFPELFGPNLTEEALEHAVAKITDPAFVCPTDDIKSLLGTLDPAEEVGKELSSLIMT